MIDASDGGFEGVRDEGGIRATLDFVPVSYTHLDVYKRQIQSTVHAPESCYSGYVYSIGLYGETWFGLKENAGTYCSVR